MEPTIIVAIIGAIATVAAAVITARAKDASFAENARSQKMLAASKYGIEIVKPAEYEEVSSSFDVSGTYKTLPKNHEIWIVTFRVRTDSKGNIVKDYWPQAFATINDGKWYSSVNNIGGRSGESKEFLVLVVGADGQALFKYFKDAGSENQKWPPIQKLTGDVVEVATGKVELK